MSTSSIEMGYTPSVADKVEIARVDASAAFGWLRKGVADFSRAPGLSLLYGGLFAALCAGLYALVMNVPWYGIAYLTGLVVTGPFVAAGLYAASRDMESGNDPGIGRSLALLRRRSTYLALFSLMLALVMAAWVRFSALLFAIQLNTLSPYPSMQAFTNMLSTPEGLITLGFFIAAGLLLVSVVFVVSAIAAPLIIDRDADFISAMQASARAVAKNPVAMLVWAGLIVALTAVGIATAFIALAVIFPILGYATWHSYRELVK
jgi:uncharacterized membrane protein